LDKISLVVNNAKANANLSQTTLDGWRTDISTARANINTAIANLTAAEEKLKTAQSDLNVAENELALEKAGSVPQQIIGQEAEVEKAEANANNIKAQISKSIIFSPINGIVTRQNTKVGEIISADAAEVSVMSDVKFEIEANIPEADIAKIKISNPAKITLDAYGSNVFLKPKW
jgi:multidrug resistance efflux pump